MTTAGERLVQLSGLSGVSAGQHLLAITQGTGSGATIFASQMTIWREQEQMTLVQRPRKAVSPEHVNSAPQKKAGKVRKDVSVLTHTPQLHVLTAPNEVWIVSTPPATVAIRTAQKSVVTRRQKAVAAL